MNRIKTILLIAIILISCSCSVKKQYQFILADFNDYSQEDCFISAQEMYFLRQNNKKSNKKIITKRIKIAYKSNKPADIYKEIRFTQRAVHFDNDCGEVDLLLKCIPKVDSLYVMYNDKTRKINNITYNDYTNYKVKANEHVFLYYVFQNYPRIRKTQN